jgi:hypothetical protein
VRLYSAFDEETLRARKLLSDWASNGFLTKEQRQLLEEETVSELRTTNTFLRLVLFFFTLIIVGAAAALFFVVFLSRPSDQTAGTIFLIFAAISYAAAETAASKVRLYRYGIEEALAVCSVAFLCVGIEAAFFRGAPYSSGPDPVQCLVPAAGAIFSIWIWHRFGLVYLFPAAMIFVIFLPGYWTSSRETQHVLVAVFYASGLAVVAAVRSPHRRDYLNEAYSLAEALLWLGIYLAINLQLSSLNLDPQSWVDNRVTVEFGKAFYWGTWVLTWCLPPIVLTRGIRKKDRFVIAVGAIVATLTLVTNKPYLGWTRHTWDPMLLGILLTGVAVFLRRWLERGPDGIRRGFTAARLSSKDKHWINVGSTAFGLLSPHPTTPAPPVGSEDFRFGGGSSGGGGAGGDF